MIDYLQQRYGLSFADACKRAGIDAQKLLDYRNTQKGKPLRQLVRSRTPELAFSETEAGAIWRKNAFELIRWASSQLEGSALDYLQGRGITDHTIKMFVLGYYPHYKKVDARLWGYAEKRTMRLPRGIVIPWINEENEVIGIRFRRLPSDESDEARAYYGVDKNGRINRYHSLYGSASQHFYAAGVLFPGCDAVLLEGELDALVMMQALAAAEGTVVALATGSTSWGRNAANIRLLNQCSQVLIAYNADEGGDKAAGYWIEQVKSARRWRPLWEDANDMHLVGVDLWEWVATGLTLGTAREHEYQGEQDRHAERLAHLEAEIDANILPAFLCGCGAEAEEYDESGEPLCASCFKKRTQPQMPQSYTLEMHLARLAEQEKAEERARIQRKAVR